MPMLSAPGQDRNVINSGQLVMRERRKMKRKNTFVYRLVCGVAVLILMSCSLGGDLDDWREKAIEANTPASGPLVTVTFYANGGSPEPEPVTIEYGNTINEPSGITKRFNTIGGWYRDRECTDKWNFGSGSVKANMELYAKWVFDQSGLQAWLGSQGGGGDADHPIDLQLEIDLGDMAQSGSGWRLLCTTINTAGKFLNLDLSACTLAGNTFNAGTSSRGKDIIVSLVLPNAAKSIADVGSDEGINYYFSDFNNLKSISCGKVSTIGDLAFGKCSSLTSVTLPASANLGMNPFAYCESLETITLTGSGHLSLIDDDKALMQNNELITYLKASGAIALNDVTGVGAYAFVGCENLTDVSFPNAISIGEYAYSECYDLKTVNFPEVLSIGRYAFNYSNSLDSVNIPKAVNIGDYAFYYCQALKVINFQFARNLGFNAFGQSGIISANFPLVTNIADWVFEFCQYLTSVDFPQVTSIGYNAFYYCSLLASVNIPNAVTIGGNAFHFCENLTVLSFPKAVSIDYGAFSVTRKLTSIELPEALYFGKNVFQGCSVLEEINLPKAETLGDAVFYNCSLISIITIPSVKSIGANTFEYANNRNLTITMGASAPKLGMDFFSYFGHVGKNVTIKVPSGAQGYGSSPTDTTTNNWGNAFRGKGWDGTNYLTGTVNGNIALTIQNGP